MTKFLGTFALLSFISAGQLLSADPLFSPNKQLSVEVKCENGKPTYTLTFQGKTCIAESPLGLKSNVGDFTQNLTLAGSTDVQVVDQQYSLYNIKRRDNHYVANRQTYTFKTPADGKERGADLSVTFEVSDNNVAFRYQILPQKRSETKCCVIDAESTGFVMPQGTTTFMCPQMGEMTGFARTAPSYETHYGADEEMGKNGWGLGYTFPCLFKEEGAWVLISETGTKGDYPGCKLVNVSGNQYQVGFPTMKENNGYGTNNAQMDLPCATPWRTITLGESLKPIVETTITWDVLAEQYRHQSGDDQLRKAIAEKYGRGAWSWIIANDESCNFETQKQYIDFAAAMGWQSLLIDAQWDQQIGRERIAELAVYGKNKGVNLYLWYNSNGKWNDAPQTPKNCMDTYVARRKEMQWMKSIGIRGIKVDFFGGDKQCTMQLYHDILTDAAEFGIMVIFHGCTLPRGWEAIYPNYVASEAVRASENLHFGQNECDREAVDATYLPIIRNTVGSMDFGGSTLNWYYNPKNSAEMWGGHRITSDAFALATAILFQSPVQHFAMAPGNLTDAPAWAVEYMKTVPTMWEDIRFIDGYPGKYLILARKSADGRWHLAGINAEKEPLTVKLNLDMFEVGSTLSLYSDDPQLKGSVKSIKVNKKKVQSVTIPCNGGFVID